MGSVKSLEAVSYRDFFLKDKSLLPESSSAAGSHTAVP